MVLALDYMQQTGQVDATLQARARDFIEKGYKRLLGFEVKSEPGGFDWWGNPPANLFLSAYGLMGFIDMAAVHDVDPALPKRIAAYLRKHQAENGSWSLDGERQPWSVTWKKSAFNMTAYVAWALARAGEDTTKARTWLDGNVDMVEDPYGLALAGLACLTADPESKRGREIVDLVVQMQQRDEEGVFWTAATETFVGGRGKTAHIETTALVVLLLLEDGRHTTLAFDGLDRLTQWRGKDGRFGSTHSTILALQALLKAEAKGGGLEARTVTVIEDGKTIREVDVPASSTEPVRVVLGEIEPASLDFRVSGEGRLRSTLSRTTWEDWKATTLPKGPITLDVAWPKDVLAVKEVAEARVVVTNTRDAVSKLVTVEIGVPPGCDVEAKDVTGPGIAEAERANTSVVLYMTDMQPGEQRTFTVPFRPRFRIDVVTAPSEAYEYYVEHERSVVPPQRVRAR